jgi:hypothetical protein
MEWFWLPTLTVTYFVAAIGLAQVYGLLLKRGLPDSAVGEQ